MSFRWSMSCAALAALWLGACASSEAKSAPAMSPEEAMAKTMELAQPGPAHQELTANAGRWNQSYKMRWQPDQPWQETSGTSDAQVLLGGRYLLEHSSFTVEGMPLEGYNLLGYDNSTGEYTSLWMDSMSTWWIESRGKKLKDGSIDYRGTMKDAAGERPFRMVVKPQADGSVVSEMYDTIPPQGETLVMTITSKR